MWKDAKRDATKHEVPNQQRDVGTQNYEMDPIKIKPNLALLPQIENVNQRIARWNTKSRQKLVENDSLPRIYLEPYHAEMAEGTAQRGCCFTPTSTAPVCAVADALPPRLLRCRSTTTSKNSGAARSLLIRVGTQCHAVTVLLPPPSRCGVACSNLRSLRRHYGCRSLLSRSADGR